MRLGLVDSAKGEHGCCFGECVGCIGDVSTVVLPRDVLLLGDLLEGVELFPSAVRIEILEAWGRDDCVASHCAHSSVAIEVIYFLEGLADVACGRCCDVIEG